MHCSCWPSTPRSNWHMQSQGQGKAALEKKPLKTHRDTHTNTQGDAFMGREWCAHRLTHIATCAKRKAWLQSPGAEERTERPAPPTSHGTAGHTRQKHAGVCEGNAGPGVACACVYAHTCVGLSAPSAAESLVYSSSTLGRNCRRVGRQSLRAFSSLFWPPVRKLGREEPLPHSRLRLGVPE